MSTDLEQLKEAGMKNEEIIDTLSFITASESIEPFKEHIVVLGEKYDMTLEVRPLEIEVLSLREKFSNRQLRNLYLSLGHGYYSLITDLFTYYQTDANAVVYAINLEEIFGEDPDYEFVKSSLKLLDNSEMEGPGINALIRYYQHKLERIAPFSPIPSYIRNFNIDTSKLPRLTESELKEDLPPYVAASLIADQIADSGLYLGTDDEEDTTAVLAQDLERMEPEDYRAFIGAIKVDKKELVHVQNDPDVFRVYGPANPFPETDFSQLQDEDGFLDANIVYGGARMFRDMSQEYDYDDDQPLDDWFRGYCMQCFLRIRAYHYAVREPYLDGGWLGCYCKWDCVREYIHQEFEEEDTEQYNIYVLRLAQIKAIEEKMNQIGIDEREYEEPTTEEEVTQEMIESAIQGLPKF
jgi:hypothetical protein